MATAGIRTNQPRSAVLPPCRIFIHSEEPGSRRASNELTPSLPASGIGGSELLAPIYRGNTCSHAGCLNAACANGSNCGSRASPSVAQVSKRAIDLIANPPVPKGYLDYWARRVDEEAADIPESEEFEAAYAKKTLSLFPFRSTTTEWTVNTAGCFLVLLMPWGPIALFVGLFFGGLLGFALAMTNDLCRLRKKTSAATQQKRKIDHLIRWAGYHFASSNAQLQLIFKVIVEYEVLARLGDISKTARSQLRLLYTFLSRGDVGRCLWLYLDYFEAHYEHMTRSEISMCSLVCLVCTQCAGTLRKSNNPPVVLRMIDMMHDPNVIEIFQKSKTPKGRQAKIDEKTERCIIYADNSQGVQTFVIKGGDLLQSLHKDCTATRQMVSSEDDSFTDAFPSINTGSDNLHATIPREEVIQDTLPGELRPVENFNVAFTHGASVERMVPWTLEGTSSSMAVAAAKPRHKKTSSAFGAAKNCNRCWLRHQPEGPSARASGEDLLSLQRTADTNTAAKPPAHLGRLFKNYEDLINFDVTLKHQTPIAPYEFQFLDEKEYHDPNDPLWELTVNQPLVQVYRYISHDSPVVLVKAYARFNKISLPVLSHNIQDAQARLRWDTTFAEFRVIEHDIDGCEVIYCLMKAPFPISNRDFLQWRRTIEIPEEGVVKIMMRSADHPSVPEKAGCVRAETLMSGYLMRQCKDDPCSSTLFLIAQTDVKGLIPKWLVNSTAARAPVGWVENLRRACKTHVREQQQHSLEETQQTGSLAASHS